MLIMSFVHDSHQYTGYMSLKYYRYFNSEMIASEFFEEFEEMHSDVSSFVIMYGNKHVSSQL